MIFPAVLIFSMCFVSASLGSDESCYLSEEQEDECASVCYPIVKPLLRYFEKCQEKDSQATKCQRDYLELLKKHSDLQEKDLEIHARIIQGQDNFLELEKRHSAVLHQLDEVNAKYENLQTKHLEVEIDYKAEIHKNNEEIKLLKDQINVLKGKSDLGTKQFGEDVAIDEEMLKNGEGSKTHVANNTRYDNNTKEMVVESGLAINNQTKTQSTDRCPQTQNTKRILQEIQVEGSDPMKVTCYSHSYVGSGWIIVYRKHRDTNEFNRKYEEYVSGFGGDGVKFNDNMFIGLERLHLLTNGKPYEVALSSEVGIREICNNFILGNRSEGYMVKNIGKCDNEGLSLRLRQGTKFSTFDRDEDGNPEHNWAKENGFGWWFPSSFDGPLHKNFISLIIRRKD